MVGLVPLTRYLVCGTSGMLVPRHGTHTRIVSTVPLLETYSATACVGARSLVLAYRGGVVLAPEMRAL